MSATASPTMRATDRHRPARCAHAASRSSARRALGSLRLHRLACCTTQQLGHAHRRVRTDLPGLVGERYRVLRAIAHGGVGTVYEAEHVHTGTRVALKLLDSASQAAVQRFERELRTTAAIDSEHVVRVLDGGTAAKSAEAFLVMELLSGRTLEEEASAPLAPSLVLELLAQAAEGIEKAHALGVVHCDLKPDNIVVTSREDGSPLVKLIDFGIAKQLDAEAEAGLEGALLGTPSYMAPEQAYGHHAEIDARTDIWAMGLIAFRLLSGRSYFPPETVQRTLIRLLFEPMYPPSELGCVVSPAFDRWFMRSCSRRASARFASISDQLCALRGALAGVVHVRIEPWRARGASLLDDADDAQSMVDMLADSSRHPTGVERKNRGGSSMKVAYRVLSIAAAIMLGCATGPMAGSGNTSCPTPRHDHQGPNGARYHAAPGDGAGQEADAVQCPMLLSGTTVQLGAIEGGAALLFTTSSDVAKLRESVRRMAEAHNGCVGDEQGAMPCSDSACMAHSCAGLGAGEHRSMHPQAMVPATASSEEIDAGARLVFRPRDPAQLATLQQQVAMRADHMAQHPCTKMEMGPHHH